MDELESRLENELSGLGRVPLAEPVPVADLRRRARRVRARRAASGFVAVATTAAIIAAVASTAGSGSDVVKSRRVRVAAPSFVLGDIDAVVLSSSFDDGGAREVIPPSVQLEIAQVPGVESVSGVIDTFAPVVQDDFERPRTPPRSPVLFSYHRDDQVHLVSGRLPAAPDEIIVDADFVTRTQTDVDERVTLLVQEHDLDLHVVGTFDLPGVDLTGIPLAAMAAAHKPPALDLDRVDVNLAPDAEPANVRVAIATAIGNAYTVVPPSDISFPDQRLAQLEIQHAYWALLSPDPRERSTAGVGPATNQEADNYERYSDLALNVELRVENVTFLSPDAASLTYRIYFGGGPSPVIPDPQRGNAIRVDGHWQLGKNTLCSLAALVGITCEGLDDVVISPPTGYQAPDAIDPEILVAFNALTNPDATLAERIAAIADGESMRSVIADGLAADKLVGKSTFRIAGWKSTGANDVEILYSLQTELGPSTPWPTTARAQKAADGHWYAGPPYACGIAGLTSGGCYSDEVGDQPPVADDVTPTTATAEPANP